MISSFGDRFTEDLFHGVSNAKIKKFPKELLENALRKLVRLCQVA